MKTVLVVDDEFSIREVLAEILDTEGYAVVTASDGAEGLEALAEHRPSLVLLDVMMPVMDGLEMLRHMQADERYREVPVILMTAAPTVIPEGPERWTALARKPFDIDGLVALVHRTIDGR